MSMIKTGDKFNRLTAIKFNYKNKNYQKYWLFRCDCGNEKVIRVSDVKEGVTRSCGCLRKEQELLNLSNFKHGMTGTKTHEAWIAMMTRCYNKDSSNYEYWGGRGIKVCNRWLGKNGFQNFYADMGDAPQKKSLDRINNNGNYEPNNCRWATKEQQDNNTRRNIFITYKNKTQTIAQWARELGIKYGTLNHRINIGWDIEKALTK